MFTLMNDLFSFINWVQEIMREKNISQSDIARTGYVKSPAISMFFSYKTKSVGVEMCRAIAAASGLPLETVMQKAGILPPPSELTPRKRQLLELAETANDEAVDLAIAMLEAAVKRKQRQVPSSGAKQKE